MEIDFINVGIADCKIAEAPDILRTVLGSCVGICIYDSQKKIGGLSHIMLPDKKRDSASYLKYANTAIPFMLEEMEKLGSKKENMVAKIVGGATMFKLNGTSIMSEIGRNNITRVREILGEIRVNIVAEDVGGDYGRTVDFYTDSGEVKIRSMEHEEIII